MFIWALNKNFDFKLPTNCLSLFDHFVILALKGLTHVAPFVQSQILPGMS